MTKVGSYISKFGVFVDQIKSKQTSLFGELFDHQLTRKGFNERIFLTRKWEKSQYRLEEGLPNGPTTCIGSESADVVFLQLGREFRGKRVAKKSQYHISSIVACKERGTT